MKLYYKGRKMSGESVSGKLKADSVDVARFELMQRGIIADEIDEITDDAVNIEKYFESLFEQKISAAELIMFCRQISALTRAGVPIINALSELSASTTNKKLSDTLKTVMEAVEGGVPLTEALSAHPEIFDAIFISMVRVGEQTGNLDVVFKQLGFYLAFEAETFKKVKQATRYPTMVVGAIFIAMVLINVFVIPAFSRVFAQFGSDLPLATKILLNTSYFTVNYWWLLLGCLVAAVLWIKKYLNTTEGRRRWDREKLRIPILGPILTKISLARFSSVFSMLSAAGVPILQAMSNVAQAMGNLHMTEKVLEMQHGIGRGESFMKVAKNAGIFSPLVIQMIAVGEETGKIDEMLTEVASFYEEEIEYEIKCLLDNLEPMLLVVMGLMVLTLALGIFLPMWNLGGVAQGK